MNDLNPSFMESIFSAKLNARVRPNDILVKARKSVTFGDKSLSTLGPKIWKTLLQNIKAENHGLNLNANVTYAALIIQPTQTFSCFDINPLLRDAPEWLETF